MAANEVNPMNGGLFAVINETENSDSWETHRKDDGKRSRRASFNLWDDSEIQSPIGNEKDPKQETLRVSNVDFDQCRPVVAQNVKVEGRKLSEPVLGSAKRDVGNTRKLSFPDVIARRSAFSDKRKKLSKGKLGRAEKQRKRQGKTLGPRGKTFDLSVYYHLREQDNAGDMGDPEKGEEYRNRRKSCIPQINIENCHSSSEGDVFKNFSVDITGPLPATPNSTEFSLMRPRRDSKSASPRLKLRTASSYSESTTSMKSFRTPSRSSRVSEFESCGTPTDSLDQDIYFSASSLNNTSPELLSCSSKSPTYGRISGRSSVDHRLGTELSACQNLGRSPSPALSSKQADSSRSPQPTPVRLKGCCSERQLSACIHEPDYKTSLPNLSDGNSLVKLNKTPFPTPSGSQGSRKFLGNSQTPTTRFSVASKEEYLDISENDCHSKFGTILSIICVLFFISYLIIIYNHFASMTRVHERFKYYTLEEEQRFQEFVVQIDIS